jgi:hypothetical protein
LTSSPLTPHDQEWHACDDDDRGSRSYTPPGILIALKAVIEGHCSGSRGLLVRRM